MGRAVAKESQTQNGVLLVEIFSLDGSVSFQNDFYMGMDVCVECLSCSHDLVC